MVQELHTINKTNGALQKGIQTRDADMERLIALLKNVRDIQGPAR
jgi:hypothetical protein